MARLTLELSDERAAALRARADAEGLSIADLVAQALKLDGAATDFDFSPEREDEIMESIEQADRGDVVSEDVAIAALRALPR
jgi:hypothetical protein